MPPLPLPKAGWQFDHLTDLAANAPEDYVLVVCDRCHHELRFVHTLTHPKTSRTLDVGLCCAVRLAGYDAHGVEKEARNLAGRRMRFLNPARWRRNPERGSLTRKTREGIRVTVFPQYGRYVWVVDGTFSPGKYPSEIAAMCGAFDQLSPIPQR